MVEVRLNIVWPFDRVHSHIADVCKRLQARSAHFQHAAVEMPNHAEVQLPGLPGLLALP